MPTLVVLAGVAGCARRPLPDARRARVGGVRRGSRRILLAGTAWGLAGCEASGDVDKRGGTIAGAVVRVVL